MRALVTGTNGTVAPVVVDAFREAGAEVLAWDRAEHPPDCAASVRQSIAQVAPDWVLHLATGPEEWAGWIAEACAAQGRRMLFTSSVSVFAPRNEGPIPPEAEPDATDDYGRYKARAEALVREAAPDAVLARLGWQIGETPGSNTMTDWLYRHAEAGPVEASTRWLPACSWLLDTAAALVALVERAEGGTYHLDGNQGLSFHEITRRLSARLGLGAEIVATDEPVMDLRMPDPRVSVRDIAERL
ncbi:MAG: sugar nucleotide-binding protein [Bacteroidota bacterium]